MYTTFIVNTRYALITAVVLGTAATMAGFLMVKEGRYPANTIIAEPMSGSVPLDVLFTVTAPLREGVQVDFGDGVTITRDALRCTGSQCSIRHVYATPGTFRVELYTPGPVANAPHFDALVYGTVTVEVFAGGKPPSPSASLTATPSSGRAPLTVELRAPKEVMEKMDGCVYSVGWFGASGKGLDVDWGDGTVTPESESAESLRGQSCAVAVRTHTYKTPGTYKVKVHSWHPGPTDGAITDWEGTTVVSVGGGEQ